MADLKLVEEFINLIKNDVELINIWKYDIKEEDGKKLKFNRKLKSCSKRLFTDASIQEKPMGDKGLQIELSDGHMIDFRFVNDTPPRNFGKIDHNFRK